MVFLPSTEDLSMLSKMSLLSALVGAALAGQACAADLFTDQVL